MLATPVAGLAQTTTAAAAVAEDEGTIVVTGSLIRNPNLISSAPVTVTTAETIQLRASNVAEEVLRDIPGIVPNIGSAVNNGNGGASFVDLRGIGANRNIVLLDGNRIAPSGLAGQVDLNNIPLALVERVDALTGAAVTTYGADAISGVVNFITKKDFSGVDLQLGTSLSERGDGQTFRADLTIGANFDGGRGNAVLSVGYQKADPVSQGNRDISVNNIDTFSGGVTGGSGTATPARFTGTRGLTNGAPNTLSQFIQTGTTTAPDGTIIPILAANPGGQANGGFRQVSQDGTSLIPQYAFFNFNPFNIFQTPFERFNMFAKASYEVSDALEVYARGMFSKNSVRTIIAPSGLFSDTFTVPLGNPFLTTNQRNQFCAFNVAPTVSGQTSTGASASGQIAYVPRFAPDQCARAAQGLSATENVLRTNADGTTTIVPTLRELPSVTTSIGRRTTEFGPRSSEYTTTLFDYQAGARGAITSNINWDLSGNYGESENRETATGYVILSRAQEALNATNATTCLSGNPLCVPLNVFGPDGSISQAASDFVSASSSVVRKTSLAQVRGLISGELGLAIPSATDSIGFALGGEYRKYRASVEPDAFSESGQLGGGGGPVPSVSGGYSVKEVYGEFIAPLVQDKPFFQNLTLEAGARYSSYTVDAPNNPTFDAFTWKAGGTWEMVDGFKVRGNYSRAIRAPNIGELFSPVSRGLTNLGVDPCAAANAVNPGNNANLRAICLAQGASPASVNSIEQPNAGQANATGGGNPNVQPEKATTWTVGAVFQPSFAPGLALTVDYYNIGVTDAITSPLPGDSIAACFGNITAASAASPACLAIVRNPITGSLDGQAPGLPRPLSNLGRIKTDGIDATLTYSNDIGFAKLGLSANFNYTFRSQFQATPSAINRECVGYYSPNCSFTGSIQPKWQSSLRTTLGFDAFDISLLWRHIDGVIQEPLNAAPPTAANNFAGDDSAFFPAFQKIKAYDYFDLTGRVSILENISMVLTVSNLFDKKPPLVGASAGSTTFNSGNTFPSTYDAIGRRYAMQVNVKF
ncbi:TonB-dependent receptor domain-containing protein [Sandarakinorhabdus sp. DWP1-3-1]|uniref:TonB-dependent receptor domain-containing protein n=1 Tax=Sandarakinorhabdus sp. DWP1-3-1 TaxID=2804627 RepID=UPI003CEA99BF